MTTREVVLDGGSPWGFRLHGGADVNQPLRISRVNPGSKAALRGIREGDFITSINGQSTKDVSNAEAHALLKNSGDTLKLGLNEDCSGSPKRRQFKTVHQETHSETVKRSSTTSFTLTSSKIISQTDLNDTSPTKVNDDKTVINGDARTNPVVSQRSTLSSNCSSSSSTPSTLTEAGSTSSYHHDRTEDQAMSDNNNVTSSRTRRRRSRNRRKAKNSGANAATTTTTHRENVTVEAVTEEYRVESPKLKNAKKPVKSKSLDDDEMVKIQELSETSEPEDKTHKDPIVCEVESDAEPSDTNPKVDPMEFEDEIPLISPEEELTLRNFLEGLNLVNSPEVTYSEEKSTMESIKAKKAKKRAAIEQYFMPIAQNPRFLDVINEETSDLSDRDQPITQHLKQGTPELEIPEKQPKLLKRKNRRLKMQSQLCIPNPVILLDTKIIEVPKLSHASLSTEPTMSAAEVVYLSDSDSPDPQSENEQKLTSSNCSSLSEWSEADTIEEKQDGTIITNESKSEVPPEPAEKNPCDKPDEKCKDNFESDITESDITEEQHQVSVTVKKNGVVVSKSDINENTLNNEFLNSSPKTTFDNLNLVPTQCILHQEHTVKKEEYFQVFSEIKSFKQAPLASFDQDIVPEAPKASHEILTQLTPPPTPENLSPKNETHEVMDVTLAVPSSRILPSPSPSLSSDGSSSRATSLCTAIFKNSSIGDVTSLAKETPLTLRELCLNYVISLPFGTDILQELAEVSLSIQDLTDKLAADKVFDNDSVPVPAKMEEDKWVAIATERDPHLLLCLSPTQKDELEKSRRVDDEAGKLLDLHEKFINRASVESQPQTEDETLMKFPGFGNNESRLLAIIRGEPSCENNDYLYYVDKGGARLSATLPRTSESMDSARLKAKDLSEWLRLARKTDVANATNNRARPENHAKRRTSLPQELYARQMEYLLEKEREIQKELESLEEEKRKLCAEMAPSRQFHPDDFHISRKGDFAENKSKRPLSMPTVPSEFFRQQMYEEYMDKVLERQERRQLKVIKVTTPSSTYETKQVTTGIEDEFMDKVKQKLGHLEEDDPGDTVKEETEEDSEPVLLMDGGSLKGARKLPKHLQEFIDMTKHASSENSLQQADDDGVWSPGQKQQEFKFQEQQPSPVQNRETKNNEPISPVWTPKSATSSPTTERKEFRPVKFESPVLGRKNYSKNELQNNTPENPAKGPPWKAPEASSETGIVLSSTLQKRLPTSHSSPASGFNDYTTPRLPRAQNPTITLLQKAREGQLPKGALYIEQEQSFRRPQHERPAGIGPGEIRYQIKNEYISESDSERPRKMADLGPRKFEGIGPTTREGMPLILRSEVKDANQSKWYKKMYDTIHKQKPHRDEYVTVRYKQRRGQYPYTSGYLSEPEPGAYDSDFADYKYATLDRRRLPVRDKENTYTMSSTMPRNTVDSKFTPMETVIKHGHDPYKNQPGRIENYIPGHSSISEKEAKEWWDEVMDIFDGHLEQQKRVPQTKSFINQALKESGYESDSTLVFRRRDDTAQQLSPLEQKEVYKVIQKGGDIPLHGLRKPAPERPKEPEPPVPPPKGQHAVRNQETESPRKYVENEVTIHYKTPVRQEIKEYLSEDELAYRQAEAMKKIYQEERRRKYLQVSKSLQELQDMNNRRHTDNFIPSQKSPIPLNRYDDFETDLSPSVKPRPRSPEPRLVARALYNFVGQTSRELTFRKGDLIYVRRQVDKNWYEGELNAMVGLFPVNYVEIVPYDAAKSTPRKSFEGQARAKFNFVAQTHLELSLAKGELVVVTRRVDDNWFEGKIGGRKGIFPVSYVEVLIDPSDPPPPSSKPVASPAAHSLLLNGSAGGKESMGSHSYTPNITSSYHAKPVQVTNSGNYGSLNRSSKNPVNEALHIETQSEPIPYRALYKYLPQNDDELELLEGDTVYVLEKCDDGWYVGSSDRTGAFGTFPGNYVEKI